MKPMHPDDATPPRRPTTAPSKVDIAVARLRSAAAALEALPQCLRNSPSMALFLPSTSPAALRAKADGIEERAAEARAALERYEEPF